MSELKRYSLGGSRVFFESEDPQGIWMKAAEVEAVMTKLEEQLNDAHGACCEAGVEEQYESSGDLVYYTVAARIRLLTAQVTALEQERDEWKRIAIACQVAYEGTPEQEIQQLQQQLAAMTEERDALQARVKELEKMYEYRRDP